MILLKVAFFSLWNSAFLQVNNSRKWMAEISDTEGNIFLQIRIWMRNKTYMGILQLRIFLLLLNILCKALKKNNNHTHTKNISFWELFFPSTMAGSQMKSSKKRRQLWQKFCKHAAWERMISETLLFLSF